MRTKTLDLPLENSGLPRVSRQMAVRTTRGGPGENPRPCPNSAGLYVASEELRRSMMRMLLCMVTTLMKKIVVVCQRKTLHVSQHVLQHRSGFVQLVMPSWPKDPYLTTADNEQQVLRMHTFRPGIILATIHAILPRRLHTAIITRRPTMACMEQTLGHMSPRISLRHHQYL